jgi:hypothetical protein
MPTYAAKYELIQPSHIRFAIKRLEVTIFAYRLNDDGVAWDIHKLAIRIAPETVFLRQL